MVIYGTLPCVLIPYHNQRTPHISVWVAPLCSSLPSQVLCIDPWDPKCFKMPLYRIRLHTTVTPLDSKHNLSYKIWILFYPPNTALLHPTLRLHKIFYVAEKQERAKAKFLHAENELWKIKTTTHKSYSIIAEYLKAWNQCSSVCQCRHIFTQPPTQWVPVSCPEGGGCKWPGCGVNHPSPPSVEVNERVEVYLYFPYEASWHVLGQTLPLPFYI